MTFSEALSAVFNDGDHVTRSVWRNSAAYLFVDEARLCITWNDAEQKADGLAHPYLLTEPDYFADDWEVVDDSD